MRFRFESDQERLEKYELDWNIDYELHLLGINGSDPLQTRAAILNRMDELSDMESISEAEAAERIVCAIDANGITLTDLIMRHNSLCLVTNSIIKSEARLLTQVYRLRWYNKSARWIRDQYKLWFVVEKKHKMQQILADSFKETAKGESNEDTKKDKSGW